MVRGEIKSVNVRTVRDKKIVRLEFDIPYDSFDDGDMGPDDSLSWLNMKVGDSVTLGVGPITDGKQNSIGEHGSNEDGF